MKRRRRRPYDPVKVAAMLIKAEMNAVTTRKPKKEIVNLELLKQRKVGEERKVDPSMLKCMQNLKDIRTRSVEVVIKKARTNMIIYRSFMTLVLSSVL